MEEGKGSGRTGGCFVHIEQRRPKECVPAVAPNTPAGQMVHSSKRDWYEPTGQGTQSPPLSCFSPGEHVARGGIGRGEAEGEK